MKIKPDVTLRVSLPGYGLSNANLTGHPKAGATYLCNGIPVSDIYLGDPSEGTAYGAASSPRLTAMSLAELDELGYAVQQARARLALWFADHPVVA